VVGCVGLSKPKTNNAFELKNIKGEERRIPWTHKPIKGA
jgi:hypothetical protein